MSDEAIWDEEDENTQANKYLLFNLGHEVYGIPITHVINIIELQKITEVPDMPNYIKGVINLRGSVIPVMDLRLRFHLPDRPYDDRTCIIIVRIDTSVAGFICDTVAEVHDILPSAIEPPAHFRKSNQEARYISGLAKVGSEVRIMLDVATILADEQLQAAAP